MCVGVHWKIILAAWGNELPKNEIPFAFQHQQQSSFGFALAEIQY